MFANAFAQSINFLRQTLMFLFQSLASDSFQSIVKKLTYLKRVYIFRQLVRLDDHPQLAVQVLVPVKQLQLAPGRRQAIHGDAGLRAEDGPQPVQPAGRRAQV